MLDKVFGKRGRGESVELSDGRTIDKWELCRGCKDGLMPYDNWSRRFKRKPFVEIRTCDVCGNELKLTTSYS